MKMIPPYVHRDTSRAERRVFELLESEDSLKGYACFHSLALAHHSYKNEAEIDFVVLGPGGLFVLEVKGGRVRRENGVWKFTDRYGRVTSKKESPFTQGKTGMYALKNDLSRKFGPTMDGYVSGYGVVFPDIEFNEPSPEWDPAMIADRTTMEQGFGEWLVALIRHWDARHRDRHGMPPDIVKKIGSYLRGDFEAVRPVSLDIKESEVGLLQLTEEQYGALDAMEENERTIFSGPAGTGKTLLAIEKARRNDAAGIRTLLLCFNRLLGSHLAGVLRGEKLDSVHVDSLHHFFFETFTRAGHKITGKQDQTKLFGETYPELFMQSWNQDEAYEELIIDEGQDILTSEYLAALDAVVKGGFTKGRWTIFMDSETQRDMFAAFDEGVFKQLRKSAASYQLSVNCRNTKPIAIQAEVISGYPLGKVKKIRGLPVKYLWYETVSDQAATVSDYINGLLKDGVKPEEIAILSPKRYQASLAGSGRLRVKAALHELGKPGGPTDSIMCGTIQAYKGLESSVIILSDIENMEAKEMKTVNYVGYTRARTALAVSIHKGLKKDYEKHFTKIAAQEGRK